MKTVILEVGFDKNGEADFGASGRVGELTFAQMDELRSMIPVAIYILEDMWRRNRIDLPNIRKAKPNDKS